MSNNTISGNSAEADAGGMEIRVEDNAVLSLVNNTISDNNADDAGGINISTRDSSNTSFRSNTITANASNQFGAGAGLSIAHRSTASFSIINTVIANSPTDRNDDCAISSGTITIDSVSIIEDQTCGASRFGDPGLLPLANNGGPTLTLSLIHI